MTTTRSGVGHPIHNLLRTEIDGFDSLAELALDMRCFEVKVQTRGEQHVFEIHVYLNDPNPELMRVELYANPIGDGAPYGRR